jgi:hypothetical protein
MEKQKAMLAIEQAIKNAFAKGFRVVVASDEEGNGWNELNPVEYAMFYGEDEVKADAIVLGVYRGVGEDKVFRDFHLCAKCAVGEVEKEGETCKGCNEALKDNKK